MVNFRIPNSTLVVILMNGQLIIWTCSGYFDLSVGQSAVAQCLTQTIADRLLPDEFRDQRLVELEFCHADSRDKEVA